MAFPTQSQRDDEAGKLTKEFHKKVNKHETLELMGKAAEPQNDQYPETDGALLHNTNMEDTRGSHAKLWDRGNKKPMERKTL